MANRIPFSAVGTEDDWGRAARRLLYPGLAIVSNSGAKVMLF